MSPVARVWNGSAWVQAPISGKVRTGSFDFTFAPAGGEPVQSNLWGTTVPSGSTEEGQALTLGTAFRVTAACIPLRPRWYVTGTPQTSVKMAVFQVGNGTPITDVVARTSFPNPNAWADLADFGTRPTLSPGTDYLIAAWTANRYPFTGAWPWPTTSGDLVTLNPGGRFVASADIAIPTGSSSVNFFPDLTVERT